MTNIIYRAAAEADIPAALNLFLESVADIYRRHDIDMSVPPRLPVE